VRKMKISIIMPVYNEKNTIKEIIRRVNAVKLKDINKEIIIVDDYSSDGTREILKGIKEKVILHDKNRGKGAAIRTGLKYATGDLVLIQDADLEYDPNDYRGLIAKLFDSNADVIYGSRFLGKKESLFGENRTLLPLHYIGNKILSYTASLLFFKRITDMETCYKLFRKETILSLNLKSNRFDIEPEITAKILKNKWKIEESPITFNPRHFSEGKKITWKDGIKAVYTLVKYRFLD